MSEDDRNLAKHLVMEIRETNSALMAFHDCYGPAIGRLVGQEALASLRETIGQPMSQCNWCRESFYIVALSGLCSTCELARRHIESIGQGAESRVSDAEAEQRKHLRVVK